MPADPAYPFVPKSSAKLRPGQFWAIPLSDGRFACGRVLDVLAPCRYRARTSFVAGLLDWVRVDPPTTEAIAGVPVLQYGQAHIRSIVSSGGEALGTRPLDLDGLAGPREIRSFYGDASLQKRAEFVFVRGSPPPVFKRRDVGSPLTDEMLRPFDSPTGVVQFKSRLTNTEFKRLAEFLSRNPSIGLRAYGSYDHTITDLEFLEYFPTLQDFSADALFHSLESLDGLRHLPTTLRSLGIGATKRQLDLEILGRFTQLRSLGIEGQTKDIRVLGQLASLEELMLRSVTVDDLSILLPLAGLRSLDLKLGGIRDLRLLPRIGRLEHVELWMIKGLNDLRPIGDLPDLRHLFLQALRQVDSLPDFIGTPALKRLHLETMKGLRDLQPINRAAGLEDLLVVDMGHLAVEDLACLVGHPSLRAVTVALGSRKKNDAAEKLLGLPSVEGFKVPWPEV